MFALLKAGSHAEKAPISDISIRGCSATVSFAVNHSQAVTIQLLKDKGNGQVSGFTPIPATIKSVSKRKAKETVLYDINLNFNGMITASHGVAQAMEQVKQEIPQHTDTNLENKNSSIFIIPVSCYLCGQQHIPFRSLQSHTMMPQSNIFGVPQFTQAVPGKEFCNFNLMRITVCPSCYFASGYANEFKRESKNVKHVEVPFDASSILAHWNATIPERKHTIESHLNGFFDENRSLEQALLSYDLAVTTCNELLKVEEAKKEAVRNYDVARKAVNYMLIKAELLMSNGKAAEAEAISKNALEKLGGIFPYLKRESSLKAVYLMGMLGLYFETPKTVNESLNFLMQYDKNNKVRFGSDEQKALQANLKKLKDAYHNRAEFSRKKLKGFNKPYEI